MRTIDRDAHSATLLPGLEEALRELLSTINNHRDELFLTPLLIREDEDAAKEMRRVHKERMDKARKKADHRKALELAAEQTRLKIDIRDQNSRLKSRNVKTLVTRRPK